MIPPPPSATRTSTLVPYTTLVRSLGVFVRQSAYRRDQRLPVVAPCRRPEGGFPRQEPVHPLQRVHVVDRRLDVVLAPIPVQQNASPGEVLVLRGRRPGDAAVPADRSGARHRSCGLGLRLQRTSPRLMKRPDKIGRAHL